MAIVEQDGFDFCFDTDFCAKCGGKCCAGESGYIWVDKEEILAFANFFQMSVEDFISQYTRKIGYHYSLKEAQNKDEYECIFFDSENRGCKVYNLRPNQCRTFPFWEHFKTNYKELENECIGILPLR